MGLIDHQIWIHHDPSPCHVKHLPHSFHNAPRRSRLDMANQPGAVGTTGTHATAWGMGWTMDHREKVEIPGNTWVEQLDSYES